MWDEYKLEVAINQLKEHDDVPALYFSDASVVDSELNLLSETGCMSLTTATLSI